MFKFVFSEAVLPNQALSVDKVLDINGTEYGTYICL